MKKNQTGFMLVVFIGWLFFICCWLGNLYVATKCDFKSDYKCEVFHAVGIFVPPAAIVTVWLATDEQ
jgi:hypothetical protein